MMFIIQAHREFQQYASHLWCLLTESLVSDITIYLVPKAMVGPKPSCSCRFWWHMSAGGRELDKQLYYLSIGRKLWMYVDRHLDKRLYSKGTLARTKRKRKWYKAHISVSVGN